MKKKSVFAMACALALSGGNVAAQMPVQFNGFLTAGVTKSDSESPYSPGLYGRGIRDKADFETDTVFGLQVRSQIDEKLSVTGQFLAKGGDGSFDLSTDWAYATYALTDEMSVRAGRLRFPAFLMSEFLEVGYAYPWARPPVEVYGLGLLSSYMGTDFLYNVETNLMDIQLQPYIGNVNENISNNNGDFQVESENLMGLNIVLSGEIATFRLGYAKTTANVSGITTIVPDLSDKLGGGTHSLTGRLVNLPVEDATTEFASVGATLDWNNFVGYAEYVSLKIDTGNIVIPAGKIVGLEDPIPPMDTGIPVVADNHGWYVTLGYRFDTLFPAITYAKSISDEVGGEDQKSITLSMRYNVGSNSALKVELQQIDAMRRLTGAAGYFSTDPEDKVNLLSVVYDVVF
ncbi:MAG: porin [Gammaproteobacteria bacterium]|nr:porin [Gammaproteobacteria bacterium]